jgi:hypothetical protein
MGWRFAAHQQLVIPWFSRVFLHFLPFFCASRGFLASFSMVFFAFEQERRKK